MNNSQGDLKTPWYRHKRYYVLIGVFITIINILSGPSISDTDNQSYVQGGNYTNQNINKEVVGKPTVSEVKAVNPVIYKKPFETNNLSNNNYYTNTYGNTVHSPAYSNDSSIPSGASARCGDGTYSFSQSRRGTCSHHGGVVEWY